MSQFHTKLTTHCPLHIILQKKELRIILLIRRIYNWMSALCMLKTLLCNGLDFELWIFFTILYYSDRILSALQQLGMDAVVLLRS